MGMQCTYQSFDVIYYNDTQRTLVAVSENPGDARDFLAFRVSHHIVGRYQLYEREL